MSARILLIDNEEGLCRMMSAVLGDSGYQVTAHTDATVAVADFSPASYDLVISDIKMPRMNGLEVLNRIRAIDQQVPVIMITAYATVETSIQALRNGAYDMLTKPFEPEELIYRVKNALKHRQLETENCQLKHQLQQQHGFASIIGSSPQLNKVLDTVKKVAARDISVLITGESGTGKELIARAIHHHSPRCDNCFMAINCGALPESVLESELFGHKKGAFTGAAADRKGIIESANGGTLFLDEIGNLPLNVQKTLLRFLQEQEIMRIGDTTPIKVDVRIVSATNADLHQEMAAGNYREDLYYRLNVVNIHLPPLRERSADIPILAAHFIKEQNEKFSTRVQGFTPEAMQQLCSFSWPGNIRQLKNVIEACMAMESGDFITLAVLAQFIDTSAVSQSVTQEYTSALGDFETRYLISILKSCAGNIEKAAQMAGMNIATIYRKLKKYQISKDDYM